MLSSPHVFPDSSCNDGKRFYYRLVAKTLPALGAAAFGLALWELIAFTVQRLRGIPFPAPWDCLLGLIQLLHGELFLDFTIYQHIESSCLRWLCGFLSAYGSGLTYAALAFYIPLFRVVSFPVVEVLQLIPGLAWVPVVILLFGLGETGHACHHCSHHLSGYCGFSAHGVLKRGYRSYTGRTNVWLRSLGTV